MSHAAILALALLLDAWLGEPGWLWSRVPHPAVLIGRLIDRLDRALNRGGARRARGVAVAAILLIGGGLAGWAVAQLPGGAILETLLGAILLAQRSLVDHVRAVADGLRMSLAQGRRAVARIVGRDTAQMDAPAIARASIESAAENFSDGVVAPAFWFLLLGLPGMLAYKAINTADSMIGYQSDRYRDFGWAVARLDDALNWLPARLSAALIALAHLRLDAWPTIRRDAPLHRSPNAGWPEAAMAVSLNVSLSGPRSYGGQLRDFPWVHAQGERMPGPGHVDRAVRALWRAWGLGLVLVLALAVA